jgi:hypothetical protein
MKITANGISVNETLDGPASAPVVTLSHSRRVPAEAKPLWQDRIKTAQTQGMEPLVEGTIARWFTAPFREQREASAVPT